MHKIIMLFTLLLCLLTITKASQEHLSRSIQELQGQSCSTHSKCYSEYAGIYYLTLTNDIYTWYILLTLRSDSSETWTSNDQPGVDQVESTNPFLIEPYGNSNGKWTCDGNDNGKIQIKDYSFTYATSKASDGSFVVYDIFDLNLSDPRRITGTYQNQGYNLNTTHLDETVSRDDKRHSQLDRDQLGDVAYFTVKGYQIDRFC